MAAAAEMEPLEPEPFTWELLAPWCNASLACELWSPPPWPADRWSTLAVVMEQAEPLARRYGPYSADAWQEWQRDLYGDDPEEQEEAPIACR